MKYIFKSLVILGMLLTISAPVSAAPPANRGGGKPSGGGGGTSSTLGIDVSWPQCNKTLPTDFAFAVVGVNGGLATTKNECLAEQLTWASQANTTVTGQDPVQLYVNTGNPWDDAIAYDVTTWPTDNIDPNGVSTLDNSNLKLKNPYGECVKTPGNYLENTNSMACSWQYGWNRSVDDVETIFADAIVNTMLNQDPATYMWWLDVEIENSWQAIDTNAYAYNRATLEGMTAYIKGVIGARVGVYSTSYQWGQIVGNTVTSSSNLYGLDSWLAGARNEKDAKKMCNNSSSLTGNSTLSLIQYVSKNLDYNVSCT